MCLIIAFPLKKKLYKKFFTPPIFSIIVHKIQIKFIFRKREKTGFYLIQQ